jgi:hypothetical protein
LINQIHIRHVRPAITHGDRRRNLFAGNNDHCPLNLRPCGNEMFVRPAMVKPRKASPFATSPFPTWVNDSIARFPLIFIASDRVRFSVPVCKSVPDCQLKHINGAVKNSAGQPIAV